MITLTQLQSFLDNLMIFDKKLDPAVVDPHMTNGLMVKGNAEIEKIGIGVSTSLKLFQMAKDKNCDAIITHHGLRYPALPRYDSIFQNRYSYLIKHGITLFSYHFLLDAHPKIGHNAQIIKILDGEIIAPYYFKGDPCGFFGQVAPTSLDEIIKKIKPKLSPAMKVYPFGKKEIRTVVALSGKGYPTISDIPYLTTNKVDLYITGEVTESTREIMREAEINLIAGGHYYTERFGLLALEKLIKEQLPTKVEFLELENEV